MILHRLAARRRQNSQARTPALLEARRSRFGAELQAAGGFDDASGGSITPPPKVEIVHLADLGVRFDRPLISSEADVEEYLTTMRAALLGAVRNGKRITP